MIVNLRITEKHNIYKTFYEMETTETYIGIKPNDRQYSDYLFQYIDVCDDI
jgi:hypothetical protein